VLMDAYNLSTQETKAGGAHVSAKQPGLDSETLPHKAKEKHSS
jgi:hypothetical protein